MIRYWAASLMLHSIFYTALTWKSPAPIEDPIVGVTLVENPVRPQASISPKSRSSATNHSSAARKFIADSAESKLISKNLPTARADVPNENELKNSSPSQENLHDSGMGPAGADIGTVSIKPRVLKQFKADYPEAAKEARVEGAVKLSVLIDTNGTVQEVGVIEGPGYGLNETAQAAMKKFVFSPAEKLGEKVPVRIVYIYRFRLESR